MSASDEIDAKIAAMTDWRGAMLARLRAIIRAADPAIVETLKWRGTPVWECGGILTTGETYRDKVKLTFAHGAKLDDPARLFNASLDGNTRRAIDVFEGDDVDEAALTALVRAAVAFNTGKKKALRRKGHARSRKRATLGGCGPGGRGWKGLDAVKEPARGCQVRQM